MSKRVKYTVVYMNDSSAEPLGVYFISTARKVYDLITSESFDGDDDRTDIHGSLITKQYLKFIKAVGICELEANESVTFFPIPEESEIIKL